MFVSETDSCKKEKRRINFMYNITRIRHKIPYDFFSKITCCTRIFFSSWKLLAQSINLRHKSHLQIQATRLHLTSHMHTIHHFWHRGKEKVGAVAKTKPFDHLAPKVTISRTFVPIIPAQIWRGPDFIPFCGLGLFENPQDQTAACCFCEGALNN